MAQTTIQQEEAIRKGSVRVLVGDDFDSLVDVGALRNPVLTSLVENQEISFDNVRALKKFVKGDEIQVSFDLCEINFTNIAKLDAGLVTLDTVAGTPVSGAEQTVATPIVPNVFVPIANQNGDGTAPTINSVTGSEDGALTAQDGYSLVRDAQGVWGIVFSTVAGSELTTLSQSVIIDYDYTPNAAKKLSFATTGTKTLRAMRLINTDENNKVIRVDISDGTNFTPISIDFAGDEEEDVAVLPVQFQGIVADFHDEQNVT